MLDNFCIPLLSEGVAVAATHDLLAGEESIVGDATYAPHAGF